MQVEEPGPCGTSWSLVPRILALVLYTPGQWSRLLQAVLPTSRSGLATNTAPRTPHAGEQLPYICTRDPAARATVPTPPAHLYQPVPSTAVPPPSHCLAPSSPGPSHPGDVSVWIAAGKDRCVRT